MRLSGKMAIRCPCSALPLSRGVAGAVGLRKRTGPCSALPLSRGVAGAVGLRQRTPHMLAEGERRAIHSIIYMHACVYIQTICCRFRCPCSALPLSRGVAGADGLRQRTGGESH